MQKLRLATPMKDYKIVNGYKLASYAETIYTYPEGNIINGDLNLTKTECHCKVH